MKSCLIVDDNDGIREIIRCIMEELHFDCDEVENGAQAAEFCISKMPDVIFLDWNMPVMNGIEFLIHLRAMHNGHRPKVLFCTSENGPDFIRNGISAGANEYIVKPFDLDMIQLKLKQLGQIDDCCTC